MTDVLRAPIGAPFRDPSSSWVQLSRLRGGNRLRTRAPRLEGTKPLP